MMASLGARALTRLRALQQVAGRRADAPRLTSSTLLAIMLALFVAVLFANVGMGAVEIPPAQALSISAQPRGTRRGG